MSEQSDCCGVEKPTLRNGLRWAIRSARPSHLLDRLGHWDGDRLCRRPPGGMLSIRVGPPTKVIYSPTLQRVKPLYVVCTQNDGFELWIGTDDEWRWFIRWDEGVLRLGWFIIWTWWIRSTWCGLRRAIWYWALRRRCEATRRHGKEIRDGEKRP